MKKLILSLITLSLFSFGAIAQNVNIPDANFKAYLVGNPAINTNSDAEIQVSEANAFTGVISCPASSISDLTGIEAFIAVKELHCYANSISTIDLSQNAALTVLDCNSNNLSTLNLSQNTALGILNCYGNNISTLNLSQNPNLTEVYCYFNNMTSINVTQNTSLLSLFCSANNLTALDVSNNTALTILSCNSNNLTVLNMKNISTSVLTNFDATSNGFGLTCIDVDNVSAATTTWINIDAGVSFSLNCAIDLVTTITVQGEAGATTINSINGTLQMEATVSPTYADDNTYTWSVTNGTGSASISSSGLLTALAIGTVTVTATANDGSGITGSTDITISNTTLNINDPSAIYNFSIFPNPVNSQLFIKSDKKIEKVVIKDITGKIVETFMMPSTSIDIPQLSKGIYFLQAQINDILITERFIKE